jgi:amidohydrolase
MRKQIHSLIHKKATSIAESMGATADVEIPYSSSYPVTYNDPELVSEMLPVITATAGQDNVRIIEAMTGAEDFSFIAERIPSFYFFLGGKPLETPASEAPSHHRGDFYIDESGFKLGVKTLVNMTLDYQQRHAQQQ